MEEIVEEGTNLVNENTVEEYTGARYLIDANNRYLYQDDNDKVSKYITTEPLVEKVDNYIVWNSETTEWHYQPYPDAWAGCVRPIPQSISPRQARLVLLKYDLLDAVESAVASNRTYSIYWEYGLEVSRNDSVLIQMAELLNLNSEMLDNLFIEGATL